jgi:hypothetical protein
VTLLALVAAVALDTSWPVPDPNAMRAPVCHVEDGRNLCDAAPPVVAYWECWPADGSGATYEWRRK